MPATKPSAPAKKVTKRTPKRRALPIEAVAVAFQHWLEARYAAEVAGSRQTDLRDVLKAEIELQGYVDEKGSLYLDLPDVIRGKKLNTKGNTVEVEYESLKNERRVTQVLNEDKAETLLTERGLLDDGTRLVLRVEDQAKAITVLRDAGLIDDDTFAVERQLDEERILALRFEEKLTQEDIDAIFDTKETFAFKPLEA